MTLNIIKGVEQTLAEFLRRVEVAIVRRLHSGVMPNSFHGIELRRIRRKQIDFHAFAVRAEPFVDFGLLVIGSIVLHQVDSMVAPVEARHQRVLQEMDIRFRVEVLGLMPVSELAVCNINARQKLLRVPLSARGNLGLRIADGPCLMQRRRLTEGRLVFVNDYRFFRPGFFLRLG